MSDWEFKLDREAFLANYWQQKPLLLKQAIAGFKSPLEANELAGLAMEETIESRIIEFRDRNWHLLHGPFAAEDFQRVHPWTLLVQAVDHALPDVAELRKLIDFIPQWRVDDVMISYAVAGGSVGPHYDNYDVFLLQGEGRRTWKLGQSCNSNTALAPHNELRILEQFQCEAEYTLSAGDILYVPPGVAHWGIAEGECMTYSIGFRAPRIKELLSRSVDSLLEHEDAEQFFRDPGLSLTTRPGEIDADAIVRARSQLLAALQQQEDDSWFGELVTEPRYEVEDNGEDLQVPLTELNDPETRLALVPAAKVAWQQKGTGVVVFANGESLQHSQAVLATTLSLCEHWQLAGPALSQALDCAECVILLEQLLERGCIELG